MQDRNAYLTAASSYAAFSHIVVCAVPVGVLICITCRCESISICSLTYTGRIYFRYMMQSFQGGRAKELLIK